MIKKIKLVYHVLKNMGLRYIIFRIKYEINLKSGLFLYLFPKNPPNISAISLEEWRKESSFFFFNAKNELKFQKVRNDKLDKYYHDFKSGKLEYFNNFTVDVTKGYDWLKNPKSGFENNIETHWTKINDFSIDEGDIKFVWEKSRFSFLIALIRYDYHFQIDCSADVFHAIEDWIDKNPTNMGPNYKCSQEISIRLLNWTFALYYYKFSEQLTSKRFSKIINSIYWQLKHVRTNINFSRIAVRNNHAITETLMLYLGGTIFSFFKEAAEWKKVGKKWFEEEIIYQVYDDGSYLLYSMNYQRIIVQQLTWAFYLADANRDKFQPIIYEKAKKMIDFLYNFQDENTGFLPNYGANDGTLLFKLNNNNFRDFSPQLNALHYNLYKKHLYEDLNTREDLHWYDKNVGSESVNLKRNSLMKYEEGGYYGFRFDKIKTFIRCGNHKNRPIQADNLHFDLWFEGKNILRDAGTFQYNTSEDMTKFFNGTVSHNTAMLGDFDQMEKGPRFIWYNWTQKKSAFLHEKIDYFEFNGVIKAYLHLSKTISYIRNIKYYKTTHHFEIIDTINHNTDLLIHQIWNPSNDFFDNFEIISAEENGKPINPIYKNGWFSDLYGSKEPTKQIVFSTKNRTIKTIIKAKKQK